MATRPKVEELHDKHWKALELIGAGASNLSEVANQIGMDPSNLHSLVKGNVEKMGNVALVFQREYSKIVEKCITEDTKAANKLLALNEKMAYGIYQREIKRLEDKDRLSDDEVKCLNGMIKAMAAIKPAAPKSLKLSQTYNYTKGLSPLELVHEFSRLRGLAQGPPDRGGVQQPQPGRSGTLS